MTENLEPRRIVVLSEPHVKLVSAEYFYFSAMPVSSPIDVINRQKFYMSLYAAGALAVGWAAAVM
jgi:hypothetical protein